MSFSLLAAGKLNSRLLLRNGSPLLLRGYATEKFSLVEESIQKEKVRQKNELILIPSESICLPEVAKVMSSDLGNIYAEGQPSLRMSPNSPALSRDRAYFEAYSRRLSDSRFYRGCIEANAVELLAKSYIAEAFSKLKGSPEASDIQANVQALSGGPANLAVFTALLKLGDPVLGLNLSHGGHLSHGSPFNVSGKYYNVTHYGVDTALPSERRKLDYNKIRELAHSSKPKLIVAGSSAYPWDFDWPQLRNIADEVGAYLLADVCHLAGMVIGGQLSNPLPYADIVVFTTHKTLFGPRGAAIVTKNPELARKIDNAVFPGLQGGPHMNSIAGIARLFEIINQNRSEYSALQAQVLKNSALFAKALQKEGFLLEYGGTNTHLMLVDLKKFDGADGIIDGETAARILEYVGIVCNKNTLPGDYSAAYSSGLRFGTPWLTQRGINESQINSLARIIRETLGSIQGSLVWSPGGDLRSRARIPYAQIQKSRDAVLDIANQLLVPRSSQEMFDTVSATSPSKSSYSVQPAPAPKFATLGNNAVFMLRGAKVSLGLNQALSCDVFALKEQQTMAGNLYSTSGKLISAVTIAKTTPLHNTALAPNYEEKYFLFAPQGQAAEVQSWLTALSDGLISINPDRYAKIDGPFTVETSGFKLPSWITEALVSKPSLNLPAVDPTKPFFVGQSCQDLSIPAGRSLAYNWNPPAQPLSKTCLNEWHKQAKGKMVPFAGWEMPVEYPTGIFKEHAAVRTSAGLFDVSHMGIIEVDGPYALPFLEMMFANSASRLRDNEAQYSYMLKENGIAIDDLYVYRMNATKFMVVVNASNYDEGFAWMNKVKNGEVVIDRKNPLKCAPSQVGLRSLRDSKVGFALQGPLSAQILAELAHNPKDQQLILNGQLNQVGEATIAGLNVLYARTGYTGEETGFEVYVDREKGVQLWESILKQGQFRGVLPIGLGARDSLRVEAGFPLFGHESEGPENLSLTEADYGYVVRLHRPFFIGRDSYITRTTPRKKHLLRLKGQGRKSVRAGQAILDKNNVPVGVVTSFAFTDPSFNFTAIAAVADNFNPAIGSKVVGFRGSPQQAQSDKITADKQVDLTVATRFPDSNEKKSWRSLYKPFAK